jgi:hypothetical protein
MHWSMQGRVILAVSWELANEFGLSNVSCANSVCGSQVGSQSGPVRGHVQLQVAIILAAQRHVRPHWATSADPLFLLWEQEAAGSNPAIPTSSEHMSILERLSLGAKLGAMYYRSVRGRHSRNSPRAGPQERSRWPGTAWFV